MPLGRRIGIGRTAEIYEWRDGWVLKHYFRWVRQRSIEQETAGARAAHAAGVPTPAVGELLEVNGRKGLEFERVDGPSMLDTLRRFPFPVSRNGRELATLHLAMHECTTTALVPYREILRRVIGSLDRLPEDVSAASLERLESLPDGDAVLHADFHPDNVVLTRSGPQVIDWMAAARGHPHGDVARSVLILRLGEPPESTRGRWLINRLRRRFLRAYQRRYEEERPGTWAAMERWMLPVAVARLGENIREERPRLEALIRSLL